MSYKYTVNASGAFSQPQGPIQTHTQVNLIPWVRLFFMLTIFLLPFFNNFPFNWGHFSRSLSFYPVLPFIVIGMTVSSSRALKRRIWKIDFFVHLFFWLTIISFFLNLPSETAGASVLTKHIAQFILFYGAYLATVKLFTTKPDMIKALSKAVHVAALIVMPYCLLEIAAYFSGISIFESIIRGIEPLMHDLTLMSWNTTAIALQSKRVRGFAMEPSYFACVVAFIFPWFLAKAASRLRASYVLQLALAGLIIYFTFSRSIYLVALVQALVFGGLLFFSRAQSTNSKFIAVALVLFLLLGLASADVYSSIFQFNNTSFSNTMRRESAIAAMTAAFSSPFLGLGYLGIDELRPFFRNEVYAVSVATFWLEEREGGAAVFSLVFRAFAEGGLTTGLAFIAVWIHIIMKNAKQFIRISRTEKRVDTPTLAITMVLAGLFTSCFSIDNFGFWGYWIMWGVGVANVVRPRVATKAALYDTPLEHFPLTRSHTLQRQNS